ncbi:hypothetical protein M0805_004745 [Coniferiporia weirii]|nr:hypothetical protein M0805_004745 [Coniferiporia weirii]
MANPYGPGDSDGGNQGRLGSRAAPYNGYGDSQTSFERPYQNYPPMHNQANPSFYKSQNNLSMTKDEDVIVSERYVSRTPSPTPSETALLSRKGFIDWEKVKNWRFWIRREWIWYYIILTIVLIIVILISVYDRQIVNWLEPTAQKIKKLPAGWVIPIAILFVISFPPLGGHEIIAILCGVVWGLWIGFAIVSAGTFLGELGNFFAFKYCCRARGEKLEKSKVQYGCLARVVREGGFKIAVIARYSAIPGHFTTAVFSTCGMSVFVFAIAAFLSLPKQFVTVYIGVIIEASGTGTETTKDKIISDSVLAITIAVTSLAMWYIFRKMDAAKPDVIYQRRKARQAKLARANSASGSSAAFNPRESDSDLPLNPGEDSSYQQWDAQGRAVGYSGNPNFSYNVHAPIPQRTGLSEVARIPTYRTEGGGGYSSSGVRYDATPAAVAPVSGSASRTASPGRPQQRQESMDTVSWDAAGQGMGPESFQLPSIHPHTPLSGGFANKQTPLNNPFTQQSQQYNAGSPVRAPFSGSGSIPTSSSPIIPPLAPPPAPPTRTHETPQTPIQYQQQSSPVGQAPPAFQPAPFQQQYQTNMYPNAGYMSSPHSPSQTPTQQAFAYQPSGMGSHPVSPTQAHAQASFAYQSPTGPPSATLAYQAPSGPPPSALAAGFGAGPGAMPQYAPPGQGAHVQVASDGSEYFTPPHSRGATENQYEQAPGAFQSNPPDYRF